MARQTKKLTNTEILKIKLTPPQKEIKLYDGDGLILRVRSTGKTWLFRYKKPVSKALTDIVIGTYPNISLQKAREIACGYHALLERRIDPRLHREQLQQEELTNNTFGEIARQWFEWKKERRDFGEVTAKKAWQHISKLFPYFEHMPITEMTPRAVLKCLEPLKKAGKLETIQRVSQRLNEVMTFALHREIITDNRMTKLTKEFDPPRTTHNPCILPKDLPKFFTHLHFSVLDRQTISLILWQLLTLSRPSETAQAKWSDIDEATGIWSYYILKGKKETEKGRLHKVPLSRQALTLLAEIKEYQKYENPYLFPHRTRRSQHSSAETANKAIRRLNHGEYIGKPKQVGGIH